MAAAAMIGFIDDAGVIGEETFHSTLAAARRRPVPGSETRAKPPRAFVFEIASASASRAIASKRGAKGDPSGRAAVARSGGGESVRVACETPTSAKRESAPAARAASRDPARRDSVSIWILLPR